MSEPAFMSAPPPPHMAALGFSWDDLRTFATHAVESLQAAGGSVLKVLDDGFALWNGVTHGNLLDVLSAIRSGENDVEEVIATIRKKFGF